MGQNLVAALSKADVDEEAARASAARRTISRPLVNGFHQPDLAELDDYGRLLLAELFELLHNVMIVGGAIKNPRAHAAYKTLLKVFATLYPVEPPSAPYRGNHGHVNAWDTFITTTLRQAINAPDPAQEPDPTDT
jgi:hypothetical protein